MAIDREKVLTAAQKFVEKKKYDKAVIEYQKLIQEDPNDARTLLKIGDLQSKMEAYAEAIVTYERVGKFYAQQGFALKAIAVFKQIREIIAKHVPQLEERYAHITPKLAELYQQLGLTSDALAALDEVATRFQRLGRDQEAIDVFRKLVDLDPTNPLPHLRLAEALSRVRDTDGAVSEFGIAAGQLVKLARRDDALKVLERLLHHKSEASHARIAAELYLARNQSNDGLQALSKLQICFQSNPKDLDTLALLARAFTSIGQAAKAFEVQKEMARIAREQGKIELFKQLVEKLQQIAPNDEAVRQLSAPSVVEEVTTLGDSRPAEKRRGAHTIPAAPGPDEPSYQSIHDADIEEAEEPFEMRNRDLQSIDAISLPAEVLIESEAPPPPVHQEPSVSSRDPRTQLARVLADAASFRRAGFFAKAIETLRAGVEFAPRSIEVRETLRDVLLEAGQTHRAVQEMLSIASLQVEANDGESAALTLQDVLTLDPHNQRAADMLRDLGYELVDEESAGYETAYTNPAAPMEAQRERQHSASYDPEAPLPSYDLEEIGPEDVAPRAYSDPSLRSAHKVATRLDEVDDPFGDAPLPAYPLDAPAESDVSLDLVAKRSQRAPSKSPSGRSSRGPVDLEDALEEADFFASRGLFDDARTILHEQLERLPNHPLVLERMSELDAQEQSFPGQSGAREMPRNSAVAAETGERAGYPVEEEDPIDRSFDIAESLGALEIDERLAALGAPAPGPSQVDVEEVFAKFKEGVAKQISVDDAQSHYDLGVAYKEMGLVDDAIREFETAARDPKRECICLSMIGMIQVERGQINEAIDALLRGLKAELRTSDQEMVIWYEIAACYEIKKMNKDALSYFRRIASRDPNYRDVQERIDRLGGSDVKPVRAVAVGADDEFDRAFEDIIGANKG